MSTGLMAHRRALQRRYPYRAVVLADNPVSVWTLGESSGTVAADLQGLNPGTYTGGFTLGQPGALGASGDASTAVLLNGSTGYVAVPDAANLRFTGNLCLEAWVYPTSRRGGTGNVILAKRLSGSPLSYEWFLDSNGKQNFLDSVATVFGPSTSAVPLNQWSYVAVVWDGTAIRWYLNGVADGTAGTPSLSTHTDHFAIGAWQDNPSATAWAGDIQYVAPYNTALSASRIAAHYAAGT